jgi:hypothetical protein
MRAENMLVQIFPGAETQKKPAGHKECCGRRRLSNNRRMNAHDRTSDASAERDLFRGVCNRTDHGPNETDFDLVA